jgi:hypothetical protein
MGDERDLWRIRSDWNQALCKYLREVSDRSNKRQAEGIYAFTTALRPYIALKNALLSEPCTLPNVDPIVAGGESR